MPKNQTNTQRAARTLMTLSDLTYAQALQMLRNAGTIPDLTDPDAVAALLATRTARAEDTRTADTAQVLAFDVGAHLWDITIDDGIGHSHESGQTSVELWPDMAAAIVKDPALGSWSGVTEASAWKVRLAGAVTADDDALMAPPITVVWADDDGEFALYDGGSGNPGCDDCGQYDAVAKLGNTYLCASGAVEHGLGWECDECEQPIVSQEAISPLHAQSCSLHPDNVIDVTGPTCHFCHKRAGADYHIAGVIDTGDNPVVCDDCWDPRLA